MADIEETELSNKQKKEIAKWFLLNSPVGEIQYVAKGINFNLSLFLWFFFFLKFENLDVHWLCSTILRFAFCFCD